MYLVEKRRRPYNGRASHWLLRTMAAHKQVSRIISWSELNGWSPLTAKSAEKLYDEGCANCDSEIAVGKSGYRPADRLVMASR